MNLTIQLSIAAVLLLTVLLVGLVFLVVLLVKSFGAPGSQWKQLAEVYAAVDAPNAQVVDRQTVQIGAVVYNRCATLGVGDQGLYVSIGRRAALVPWTEFTGVGQTTLHWKKLPVLSVSDPPVATIAIPVEVFEQMQSRLPAGLIGAG